jgi:hypothetical protein
MDTAADNLQIDVKVNFSSKQKGAWLDPDSDLEDLDSFTPEKIT